MQNIWVKANFYDKEDESENDCEMGVLIDVEAETSRKVIGES